MPNRSSKWERVAALVQTDEYRIHEEEQRKSESNACFRAKHVGLNLHKRRSGYRLVLILTGDVYRGDNYELDLDDVNAILTEAEDKLKD